MYYNVMNVGIIANDAHVHAAHDTHAISSCTMPGYIHHAAPSRPYYIPFRALTNGGARNLLVAGKTMATTFSANSAACWDVRDVVSYVTLRLPLPVPIQHELFCFTIFVSYHQFLFPGLRFAFFRRPGCTPRNGARAWPPARPRPCCALCPSSTRRPTCWPLGAWHSCDSFYAPRP